MYSNGGKKKNIYMYNRKTVARTQAIKIQFTVLTINGGDFLQLI